MIRNKWGVFFTLQSVEDSTKFIHHYEETDSMTGAARILVQFHNGVKNKRPFKGYEIVKVEIKEAEQLEMELFDLKRWWD